MADFKQSSRQLRVTTALGEDAVWITGLRGSEEISSLFWFELDLIGPLQKPVDFAAVLGQPASVEIDAGNDTRKFRGIISEFAEGRRDQEFIHYTAVLVPPLWMLTRVSRSRVFDHIAVPALLKEVLAGLDYAPKIQGDFRDREYVVQYRETDFNFASRRMEEEGIFYFSPHYDGPELIVGNNPEEFPEVPFQAEAIYDETIGGNRPEHRIYSWVKRQEVRSGKVSFRDHHFQKPHKRLEAVKATQASVSAGTVSHNLALTGADGRELYDYPGEYSMRFDGIDLGGGEQPAALDNIDVDNRRRAEVFMQAEAAQGVTITAASDCRQMTPGHKFKLKRHPDADGEYVVTAVTHQASLPANYRTGQGRGLDYSNEFTCIPSGLPYRPRRRARLPFVQGSQTAVVVGPPGEEIFTDKYGRVKVQFHWDRVEEKTEERSCWLRVGTLWAGTTWGVIHIPRIGHEVIVDFLEGDPDRPLIVGSVPNAETMPPWELPANKTQSGILSRSSPGGSPANANAFRFEDKKGEEQVWLHAEKNQDIEVENDETHWVGRDRTKTIDRDETTNVKRDRTETVNRHETITVDGNRTEHVKQNETITIDQNRTETVKQNETITVVQNRTESVQQNETVTITLTRTHNVGVNDMLNVGAAQEVTVGGARALTVGAGQAVSVGGGQSTSIGGSQSVSVGGEESVSVEKARTVSVGEDDSLSVGKSLTITAEETVTIKVGKASITMKKDGTIVIDGKDISIKGSGEITGKASKNMTLKGKKILQN